MVDYLLRPLDSFAWAACFFHLVMMYRWFSSMKGGGRVGLVWYSTIRFILLFFQSTRDLLFTSSYTELKMYDVTKVFSSQIHDVTDVKADMMHKYDPMLINLLNYKKTVKVVVLKKWLYSLVVLARSYL